MAQQHIYEQKENQPQKQKTSKAFELVLNGLLIAIVFIATKFIQFQLPGASTGGLVHLGNIMVFTIAIVFGPKRGFIAAAIGMALFDVLSGWASYAPITFIAKGIMAYIAGYIAYAGNKNGTSTLYNTLGIVLGGIAMIATYYIGEIFMLGNVLAPLANVPGNITQIVIGYVIAIPFAFALKKTPYFKNF